MKRLLLVLALGCVITQPAAPMMFSTFDVGFDFRSTAGFVTDGACCTNDTSTTVDYPTTQTVNGNSVTFGWETVSGLQVRDRSNSVDARIAGMSFTANDGSSQAVFRVDLPSTGTYNIGLAMGDGAGGNPQNIHITVKDSSSALITFSGTSVGSSSFLDAAGNQWSTAAWPGSNVTVQKTFTTTILRVSLDAAVDSNSTAIAHLRITQGAATAGSSIVGKATVVGGTVIH